MKAAPGDAAQSKKPPQVGQLDLEGLNGTSVVSPAVRIGTDRVGIVDKVSRLLTDSSASGR
jgi:hypothetical protein